MQLFLCIKTAIHFINWIIENIYWYFCNNIYTRRNSISMVLVNSVIQLSYLLDGDLIDGIIPNIDFHDQIGICFSVRTVESGM